MGANARKLDGGRPAAIGQQAILALMATYPPDFAVDWTPQEAVIAKSGELGFTWGNYRVTFHDKAGKLVTEYGKYLDVWRRQNDGTWRWIADAGNSNPPPSGSG
jgi:ketosteroid isomerase-like protein